MNRYLKLAGITVLSLAIFTPIASARPPVFFVGGGFYGPAFYGPAWYGPGWYAPYGYVRGPVAGAVKFDTTMKDAQVYVDGGYAGTVKQLGTFPLRPGTHDIELRAPGGQSIYDQNLEVIAGKTIKIKL